MPNDVMINRGKLHDAREWATFILSFITVIAIPVGLLVLNNQRMEIEKEISDKFLSKTTYSEDRIRIDQSRMDEVKSIGEIQGKLNSLFLEQVRMSDNISLLKDQVTRKP